MRSHGRIHVFGIPHVFVNHIIKTCMSLEGFLREIPIEGRGYVSFTWAAGKQTWCTQGFWSSNCHHSPLPNNSTKQDNPGGWLQDGLWSGGLVCGITRHSKSMWYGEVLSITRKLFSKHVLKPKQDWIHVPEVYMEPSALGNEPLIQFASWTVELKPSDLLWFLRCVTWPMLSNMICRSWVERLPSTFKPDRMGVLGSSPARCLVAKMQKTKYTLYNPFGVWFGLDSILGRGVELTQFGSRRCVKSWRSSWQWHPQHPASFSNMGRSCRVHLVHLTWPTSLYDSGVHPAYDPHGSQADEGQEMKHK